MNHGSEAGPAATKLRPPLPHAAASTAIATAEAYGLTTYHSVAPAYAIRSRTGSEQPGADASHAVDAARRSSTQLVLAYVLAMCGDTLLELGDATGKTLLTEARTVIDRLPDPGIAGRYLARSAINSPTTGIGIHADLDPFQHRP